MIDGWGISCEIALRWMPLDLTDEKSTLVRITAWCRQATSHYLSQCWPRSMSPNGVTSPQWVKTTGRKWAVLHSVLSIGLCGGLSPVSIPSHYPKQIQHSTVRPSDACMCQWAGSSLVTGNSFSPLRRKAITRNNADWHLKIGLLGANVSENLIMMKKHHPRQCIRLRNGG